MGLAELRALVRATNFATHGVSATVTRPQPRDTPVATSLIWLEPDPDLAPAGEVARMDHRRIAALRRDDLPQVERGTTVRAAELPDGVARDWIVDGVVRVEPDQIRVRLVEAETGS